MEEEIFVFLKQMSAMKDTKITEVESPVYLELIHVQVDSRMMAVLT